MESALLPAVGSRHGLWAIGPVFAGSEIMPGDADLIAGGLLTELKTTSKKPSLGVTDLWQMLGYVLMDYVDEYAVTDVALFSARYGYLAQWNLDTLLPKLAEGPWQRRHCALNSGHCWKGAGVDDRPGDELRTVLGHLSQPTLHTPARDSRPRARDNTVAVTACEPLPRLPVGRHPIRRPSVR
jgi:hypothetical protein